MEGKVLMAKIKREKRRELQSCHNGIHSLQLHANLILYSPPLYIVKESASSSVI